MTTHRTPSPIRLMPPDAYDLLQKATWAVQEFGYPVAPGPGEPSWTWAYPIGLLMAQWLRVHGVECEFTPPTHIPRALFQPNFTEWHLLSDELMHALNLANRLEQAIAPPEFLAGEIIRRRRSPLFRFWRRLQRLAEWTRQRLFHGAPLVRMEG